MYLLYPKWVEYDNVVWHYLPIVQLLITYRLILRRTRRTSDQMHSGYTSDINNGRKVDVVPHVWYVNKHVHSKLFKWCMDMSLWNLSWLKFCLADVALGIGNCKDEQHESAKKMTVNIGVSNKTPAVLLIVKSGLMSCHSYCQPYYWQGFQSFW